jgi:hypothetical protein
VAALRALGGRYAGSRCLLALADAHGVACERFRALPLAGLAYDPVTRAVVVAFGASSWNGTGEPPGLVHRAREVVAIDRLVDADGTIRALHVVGTSAEAVLSFA